MSEVPPHAEAMGTPELSKQALYLKIGGGLAVVAVVALGVVVGWVPNFLGSLVAAPEFYRYVAEVFGFYALVFLLVGLLGAPSSPRDYFGGAALVALALFAHEAARDLPGMRGFAFGPGTAPRMFAYLLIALGLAVSATGLFTKGPGIDRFYLRGPVFVTASVVLFAIFVRPLGLAIASFVSICAAAGATPEARVIETIIWGVVLTAFCVFLFVYALNLPMQIWPVNWDIATIIKGIGVR